MNRIVTKLAFGASVLLAGLGQSEYANAQMKITEFMYSGANGEFVEFTNVGDTAINMNGWKYGDSGRLTGTVSLSSFGTVQPGESIILTETAIATFRTAWGLCSGVKIIGSSTSANLGRSDEINLYDGANTLIDRLTYNDEGSGTVKAPRTQNKSAYRPASVVNVSNNASLWPLSAASDVENSAASTGGDVGSPGKTSINTTTQSFNPCPPASSLTITLNATATTDFIDGGSSATPATIAISAVINDPKDPGAVLGTTVDVKDNNVAIPASGYTLTGTSNNTAVITNANIVVTKSDGSALVKLTPGAAGYATVTLTLTKSGNTKTFTIDYAASAAAANPSQSVFHTGYSDGSAAVAIDNDYMVVADDEKNMLNVYARNQSGLPVKSFDYSAISGLNLTDVSGGAPREIDVEAMAKSVSASTPNRSYWLGSLSNQSSAGSNFNDRPNRNRIFALNITNTGAATAFSYVGAYQGLRNALISWGNTYSLGLSASAATGEDPKLINGFNVEGMAFAPDNTTMYIGFRAPLEPVSNRINALIAPIQNFETWFGTGTSTTPTFGAPILLNLNGRGIRDIGRLDNGLYVILAGDYDDAGAISSAIYRWNGNANDAPVALTSYNVTALNPEGVLPVFNNGVMNNNQLQIISDNGAVNFYNDNTDAKDLTTNNFKKFRSDYISSATPLPIIFNDFKATYMNSGKALLGWECAVNNAIDYFILEKSMDGQSFESIYTAFPTADKTSYSYVDEICCAPAFFYRVREMMKDGSSYYTNIKMVSLPEMDKNTLTIGYNQQEETAEITMAGTTVAGNIRISDLSGRTVFQQPFTANKTNISLAGMPQGILIIEVRNAGTIKRLKVVR